MISRSTEDSCSSYISNMSEPAFTVAAPMSRFSLFSPMSKCGTAECQRIARARSVPSMVAVPSVTSEGRKTSLRTVPTKHDLATGRDPDRVRIFDTTLRDGEQSPGATLTAEEKMVIAKQLAKLGVDVIEAGFPIASEGDFKAVESIAKVVGNRANPPIICGLARAMEKDIMRCYEAVKHAAFPRIHTFIATSDVHMEFKLKKTHSQILEIVHNMVTYAKSLCDDIEFSAEDALRSDPEFLVQVFDVAIAAGATTINVPDTVGYTTPKEFGDLIQYLRKRIKGIDKVIISVHGHDDLGIAVANFLSAVENGARQTEVTINGIGERAGNASLEEVVMALHVRRSYYNASLGRPHKVDVPITNINHSDIFQTSRMVSNLTGIPVQPNKAIVGANAFAHESGIHQDGVLKHRQTYEIMDAKSIGLTDNLIVLGKLSGRHAFRARLEEMGYDPSEEEIDRAFKQFKDLADKKKEVSMWDLETLITNDVRLVKEIVQMVRIQVQCGNYCVPTATVTLKMADSDEEHTVTATGTGPVDAAFQAINLFINDIANVSLLEYQVNSVTKGIDALGEVLVRVRDGESERQYTGSSANTDVVVASAQAYINALNRCHLNSNKPHPIHPQFGATS